MQRLTPVDVLGLSSGVGAIASGALHTCAVLTSGGLRCWGLNGEGQLGDGSLTQRLTPVEVLGLSSGVVAVSPGDSHTCALLGSGGVKCWGLNTSYQLGDGSGIRQLTPVSVSGLSSGVAAVSSGPVHACALLISGGVKCWGSNGSGRLGDGSLNMALTPIDVSGLSSGAASVSSGGQHSCAFASLGILKCWGANSNGQLGDGSTTNRYTPVATLGISTVFTLPSFTPAISGTSQFGSDLVASPGTVDPAATITTRWLRDGSGISGATASTYTLTDQDIGAMISARQTHTLNGVATTRVSPATARILGGQFDQIGSPRIVGPPRIGSTLVVDPGEWPAGTLFDYQWYRDGEAIAGATGSSFDATSDEFGRLVTVVVTAYKPGVAATQVSAGLSNYINYGQQVLSPTPTISGTAVVGNTLTATPGTWDAGVALKYQWFRDSASISGATSATYVVTMTDVASTLSVKVTGTKEWYLDASKVSTSTASVLIYQASKPTPTISGTVEVGRTLTAVPGAWDAGVNLAYQWFKNNVAISGATDQQYTIPNGDTGAQLSVSVTSTKTNYVTETRTSAQTVQVDKGSFTLAPTPIVSGTAAVGQVLTLYPGTWDAGTTLSYNWYRNGVLVAGPTTTTTYTVQNADAGYNITARVTATKLFFTTTTVSSDATSMVTGGTLTLKPTPTTSGLTTVGETLTALTGTWDTGVSLAYQWKRGGVAIEGATASTYTLVDADAASTLAVSVTASKPGFNDFTVTSASTPTILRPLTLRPTPTISGSPQVTLALTADPGTWDSGVSLTYQWLRNGANIAGATASTYTLVNPDAAKRLTVTVTATKPGYATVTRTSAATELVFGGLMVNKPVPTLSGEALVGVTLVAGNLGPWDPGVTAYPQWFRDDVAITGATGSSYVLVMADAGRVITVKTSAYLSGYFDVVTTSAPSAPVLIPMAASTPTISGTPAVGATLTANPGAWTTGTTLAYQWNRNGVPISGATSATYTVENGDAANSLTVMVSGTKLGYKPESRTSSGTALVSGGTFTLSPTPTVSGTLTVGSTLTATPGTWDAGVTLTYQWYRDGVPICGATSATYVLRNTTSTSTCSPAENPVVTDAGRTLTVRVTGTKAYFNSATRESTATGMITGGKILVSSTPVIGGTPDLDETGRPIPGKPIVAPGVELTAITGTWDAGVTFSYQWIIDGVPVLGPLGTGPTYIPTVSDLTKNINVKVTGSKPGFTPTISPMSTAQLTVQNVFALAPIPTITGTAQYLQTLTADEGTWSPTPTQFRYQWNRNGTAIAGATLKTYSVQPADIGTQLSVSVVSSVAGYVSTKRTSVVSASVLKADQVIQNPTVSIASSNLNVGSTLIASRGTWDTGVAWSYSWRRSGVPIAGANAATYVLTNADAGENISLSITGSKQDYNDLTVQSSPTAMITGGTLSATPVPTVTGTATVGQTLTATPGTWDANATLTYQWLRGGAPISGATESTHLVDAADAGLALSVAVTGNKPGFNPTAKTSVPTVLVLRAQTLTPSPTISGTLTAGSTLTATPGTWGPGGTLTYAWLRNGATISGATSPTYVLTGDDYSAILTAQVTCTRSGYETVTRSTNTATSIGLGTLTDTRAPPITGSLVVSMALSVNPDWTPTPTTYMYQWLRNGSEIYGATAASYTLVGVDYTSGISVRITSVKHGWNAATVTTPTVGPIGLGTLTAPDPVINTSARVGDTLTATTPGWNLGTEFTYLWERDGVAISDATDSTYTVTNDDAGHSLNASVVATNFGYNSVTKDSNVIALVTGGQYPELPQPGIVGRQIPGQAITAVNGVWPTGTTFAYQWYKSTELQPTLVAITTGGTTASYTLPTTAPATDRYTVTVTASKTGYDTRTVTSATTGNSFLTVPVPTVTGTLTVGSVLTVNQGTWFANGTNQPDVWAFQWYAGNQVIPGATLRQYTLTTAEFGDQIRVEVTGTETINNGVSKYWGSVTASSALTTAVGAGTNQAASVSLQFDALTPGNEIKAIINGFTDAKTIQWYRGTTKITNATAETYVISSADVGSTINVSVTDSPYGFVPIVKNAVTPRAVTSNLFVATPVPTILGDAAIDSTLSVEIAEWTPAVDTMTYQWLRNGVAIPNATGSEYVLAAADVDKTISVTVTGARVGYSSVSKTSQATDSVTGYTWDSEPASADIVVTGTYKVGEQLVAATPTWAPSEATTVSYQWFRGIDPISNATAASYVLTPADQGYYVTVKMTARHSGYSPSTVQSPGFGTIGVVQPGTFEAPLPLISGNFSVGSTLTANAPAIGGVTTTVAYQWQRNGIDIATATGKTYVLVAADLGAFISVKVTYSASGYVPDDNIVVSSKKITTVFTAPTSAQAITGGAAPKVGQTLTAAEGTWTPAPTSYNYVWKIATTAAGTYTNIPGATSRTYVVKPDDVGKYIKVEVVGVKDNYDLTPQLSAATAVVALGTFATPPTPTISGTLKVGQTLTASEGTWAPLQDSFSYVWQWSATVTGTYAGISGATGKTYQLQPGDRGRFIKVVVTAVKAGYTSGVATSAASVAVVSDFTSAPNPTISVSGGGAVAVGKVLTAVPGVWSPTAASPPTAVSPTALSYVWQRDGVAISGATASTYTLVAADLGKAMTVTVTGTLATYVTTSKTSVATDLVAKGTFTTAPNPSLSPAPTSVAPPQVGKALTAVVGVWAPALAASPVETFYQWSVGGIDVAGSAGTAATFTPRPADVGSTVTLTVTAKKAGYEDTSRSFTTTQSVVAGVFTTSPVPTITVPAAGVKVGQTLTAAEGTWSPVQDSFTYVWKKADTATGAFTAIPDAINRTYLLKPEDADKFLKVEVTAIKAGYTSVMKSVASATVAVARLPFTTTPVPTITVPVGGVKVGQTLTASEGTWAPLQDSFSYVWQWSATVTGTYAGISGATGKTYQLQPGDRGRFIKVVVTAVKAGYTSGVATSAASVAVVSDFTSAPNPTISVSGGGAVAVGKVLTAVPGVWSPTAASPPTAVSPTALSYVWQRDGVAISGATASTYTLVAADLGKAMTVTVTGTLATYVTTSKTSVATDLVAKGTFTTAPNPSLSPAPTSVAPPQVGKALTAVVGVWAPALAASPVETFYQWSVGGIDVAGSAGTAATFTPRPADVGSTVTLTVTAKKAGYEDTSRSFTTTQSVVAGVFTTSPVPTITVPAAGVKVGQTLTAAEGTWSPVQDSFTYVWKKADTATGAFTAIPDAINRTYLLKPEDADKFLKVEVTAIKAGYTSVMKSVASATVAVARLPFTTTPVPTITVPVGGVKVGQTLTASEGTWAPLQDSFSYVWKIANTNISPTAATGWTVISGAVNRTYELQPADADKFIMVEVTGIKAGYTSTPRSVASATVAVARLTFTSTATPTNTGTLTVDSILTANEGDWAPTPDSYTYTWMSSATAGGTYAAISGATAKTYKLKTTDRTKFLKVVITAVKAGYTTSATFTSAATTAIG